MKPYQIINTDGETLYQFELVVHQDVKRVLTLEQLYTLFRQTAQPDSITRRESQDSEEDDTTLFQNGGGERFYQIFEGEWQKGDKTMTYYMDDDMVSGADETLSAALVRWECAEPDAEIEALFAAYVDNILVAQENFLLYGTMKGF